MKKRNLRKNRNANNEIIGVLLLLGIAISLFSVVYLSVLSTDISPSPPASNIVGSINAANNITIEHWGAEAISADAYLLIDIAGERQPTQRIGDLIVNNMNNPNSWDFGEQLIYPVSFNISDVRVEATVVDKDSNSIVMYSILNDGVILSSYGRGAVWHLDEAVGTTAYDSSGNRNHGTIHGAEWTGITEGINQTGLEFNPLEYDYVSVEDSFSLDLTSTMSMEAWFKPEYREIFINQTEFNADNGYYPNITHVHDSYFAVVYRHDSNSPGEGILQIMDLESTGNINDALVHNEVIASDVQVPKVLTLSPNCVAVAYGDGNDSCQLKTYEIDSSGLINTTVDGDIVSTVCNELSFIKVAGNVYVFACCDKNDGMILTINISDDGIINPIIDSYNFSINNVNEPDIDIAHISNDVFVVAYVDKNSDLLFTINISSNGSISNVGKTVDYYTGSSNDPDILRLTNDGFAIAFDYDNHKNGLIKTYHLLENGSVSFSGYDLQFEDSKCIDPDILSIYNDLFIIAYQGPTSHVGSIAELSIDFDTLEIQLTGTNMYASTHGEEPDLFKISPHVYGIVFLSKTPHPGNISTFSYISYYDDPSYISGIHKENSYGIYANTSNVFCFLNNQTLSFELEDYDWIHVVMTYDGSTIKLYRNASLVDSVSYNEPIQRNGNDLYIGENYEGIIDEIAIYESVLSDEEVLNHYNNPGMLE